VSWPSGETVVVQEVWDGRVWAARPMSVVDDDGDFVALWFPKGTIWKRPTSTSPQLADETRGTRLARCLSSGEWVFEDAEWDVSTLVLMRSGDWHAVWVSWLDDGTQWGWYVNLQRPYRRTVIGFETMDLALDVLVENDRTWRWKDEDELETFVTAGVLDGSLADHLRVEGLRVARKAERNEPPFDESWSLRRPAPARKRQNLEGKWDGEGSWVS
jgi:predicted RNA-binding protein associated with RNAse of E/G family